MTPAVHPSEALFREEKPFPRIRVCEHYAGNEKFILLAAQDASWGPIRHQGELHDRASYCYYWW